MGSKKNIDKTTALLRLKPERVALLMTKMHIGDAVRILKNLIEKNIKKAIAICNCLNASRFISISEKLTSNEKKQLCENASDEDKTKLGSLLCRFRLPVHL